MGSIIIIGACLAFFFFLFLSSQITKRKKQAEKNRKEKEEQKRKEEREQMLKEEPWRAISYSDFTKEESAWISKLMENEMFMSFRTAQKYVYDRRKNLKNLK